MATDREAHRRRAVDVDDAMLRVKVADAGTEARLAMTVRTATVTTRTVTLPAGAHLGSVKIAGAEVPMARDATELRLPLQPGVSEVDIEWKQDDGVQTGLVSSALPVVRVTRITAAVSSA